MHGNERNFVSALVTLDADTLGEWASQHGLAGRSYSEIVTSDAARDMVQGYIDELNARLNRWESVKKFVILERDLSVEEGEITPSMKVKRKVVERPLRRPPRRPLPLRACRPRCPTVSRRRPTAGCPNPALSRPGPRAVRDLRARAVLLGALRVLRLQHLYGRPSSARHPAPRGRRTRRSRSRRYG